MVFISPFTENPQKKNDFCLALALLLVKTKKPFLVKLILAPFSIKKADLLHTLCNKFKNNSDV